MMKAKFWFVAWITTIGVIIFFAGYAQGQEYQVDRVLKLVNGEAEDIQYAPEMEVRRSKNETIRKGVGVRDTIIPSGCYLLCSSGNNAFLHVEDADVWLNYNTLTRFCPEGLFVPNGQLYTNKPGGVTYVLSDVLTIRGDFADDLDDLARGDRDDIPNELREAFKDVGITLPQKCSVVAGEPGNVYDCDWLIYDVDKGKDKGKICTIDYELGELRISVVVNSNGTEFSLKGRTDKDSPVTGENPAIIYLFKGEVNIGSLKLTKEKPVAAVGEWDDGTGTSKIGLRLFDRDKIPGQLEHDLFRMRMWRNDIRRLMRPFWLKPQYYAPAATVVTFVTGIVFYKYIINGGAEPSLSVTVSRRR